MRTLKLSNQEAKDLKELLDDTDDSRVTSILKKLALSNQSKIAQLEKADWWRVKQDMLLLVKNNAYRHLANGVSIKNDDLDQALTRYAEKHANHYKEAQHEH